MNTSIGRIRRTLAVVAAVTISSFAIPGTTTPEGGTTVAESPVAAPAPPAWEAEARRSISEREYEASDASEGLQAPNRANGLRTFFEPSGARVVDRKDATELVRLRTVSVAGVLVGDGEVTAEGPRVEVRRPGLVEWFVNSEHGLEHGWTIASAPLRLCERSSSELTIEVAFDVPVRVEGDRAIVAGLEYAGLAAWDARGAVLPMRMDQAGDDRVRITVDDAGAEYPVTVDPTLSSPVFATLSASQTTASLGLDVDGAGDVNNDGFDDLVVGAPNYDAGQTDEGAAFIFLGGPAGIATADVSAAATRLEGNQASAWMGYSVAGAGDVNNDGFDDVVVGAVLYDSGQTDEGAAFVFLGGPSGIPNGSPASANATLQSNQISGQVGFAVAGAGDVNNDGFDDVVVGAVVYDAGQTDEGAAFVFLGSPSGIPSGSPASANTVLQSDQAEARMGWSVAGAGDTNGDGFDDVVVGAVTYDAGQTDEGTVYVFLGGAAGIPNGSPANANATFQANQAGAQLGVSVAGAGDTNGDGFDDVVVGAHIYDNGQTDEGVALLFLGGAAGTGNGDPATADALLQADQANGRFGTSVAGAGDVDADGFDDIVVGAYLYDAGHTDEGVAFVYFGRASGAPSGPAGSTAPTILQQDQAGAAFGYAVAGAGDTNGDGRADVIVGAFSYDTTAQDAGAAFVYLGGLRGLHGFPGPDARLRSGQTDSVFGHSVAPAGDVNGDGFDDILVGAPNFDAGQTDEGAVFIFHGGPNSVASGDISTAATFLQGDQAGAELGIRGSVAGAGDVNGDGFDDIVAGAHLFDSGQFDEGAAFVFHGGPNGIASGSPATANAILQSDDLGAELGAAVSMGDVNNDGFDDVLLGVRRYNAGRADSGAVFVFHGGPTGVGNGTPANADGFIAGIANDAYLGAEIAGLGDVNGDGYGDLATTTLLSAEWRIQVHLGGFAGIGTSPATTITGGPDDAVFGFYLGAAGDVNADGYDDLVAGLPLYELDQTNEGAVFVFHGSPTGIPSGAATAVAATQIYSNQPLAYFGFETAGAGDVNGDGFDDIVATSSDYSGRQTAFVFLGGPTGVEATSVLDAAATVSEVNSIGVSAAGAGDVDGDGFDDIVVGYLAYTGTIASEGGAFVYHLMRPEAGGGTDTVGIYIGASGFFFLRNQNAPGSADLTFGFGPSGLGWIPLSGDWDGDGDDTVGLYAPSSGFFFLRNSNAPGNADLTFGFGPAGLGWVPVVGDWDGDGDDTIGLYAPSSGFFFLRNSNAPGNADLTFGFGPAGLGWAPVVGDWDGDGDDTIGLYAPSSGFFFLRNQNAPGNADLTFGFGPSGLGWLALTGDWDGDGATSVGLYAPSSGFFFLRNQNAPGNADLTFGYGPSNVTPLVGDWDGL